MFHRNILLIPNRSELEKIKLIRRRRELRDASDPLSLPPKVFTQRFRLSKETFLSVLETINLPVGCRSTYIPPILRLGATLEILGGGGYQWLTGNDFGVTLGQSTLSTILHETTRVLEMKLCSSWIVWRVENPNQKAEIKQYFHQKFSIPGVVGCVDGTHLFLQRPRQNEEMYFNRKGRHSLNAMIICDHKMRIMAINPKYAGSAHDSLVWKHSNERAFFRNHFNEQDNNSWLLGDSGYPLEPWLLSPYRSSNDSRKTHFNEIHAKARNIVERCIGVYKGRWRILMEERKTRYDPGKIAIFANVCAALHNICIHRNEPNDFPTYGRNHDELDTNTIPETSITESRIKHLAERTRDSIKDLLFN